MIALWIRVFCVVVAFASWSSLCWPAPLDDADLDARIDSVRKGDLTVRFVDADGRPLSDQKIEYVLSRHDFLFGTAISTGAFNLPANDSDRIKYLDIVDKYFNYAVHENALKWYNMERRRGRYDDATPMKIWEWCRDHDITMRGHCVFWGRESIIQPWIMQLSSAELETVMKARAARVLRLCSRKIMEHDLNNEMMHTDYFRGVLGLENGAEYFKWCRNIAPDMTFYVNEYGILSGSDTFKYVEHIRELIESGAEVGGIGVQSHFMRGRVPDNVTLWAKLEALSQFGLPIKVTEFDITSDSDARQAADLRRFYRVCLAHPSVEAILMWGFWEGAHWIPRACLWRRDWTPRPAAEAYVKLVTEELTTEGEAVTSAQGEIAFRGFFGTYTCRSGSRTYTAELTRDRSEAVAKPQQ